MASFLQATSQYSPRTTSSATVDEPSLLFPIRLSSLVTCQFRLTDSALRTRKSFSCAGSLDGFRIALGFANCPEVLPIA